VLALIDYPADISTSFYNLYTGIGTGKNYFFQPNGNCVADKVNPES